MAEQDEGPSAAPAAASQTRTSVYEENKLLTYEWMPTGPRDNVSPGCLPHYIASYTIKERSLYLLDMSATSVHVPIITRMVAPGNQGILNIFLLHIFSGEVVKPGTGNEKQK